MPYGKFTENKKPELHRSEAKITFFGVAGQALLMDFLEEIEGMRTQKDRYRFEQGSEGHTYCICESSGRKYTIYTSPHENGVEQITTLTLTEYDSSRSGYKNARDLLKQKLSRFQERCTDGGVSI